MAINGLIETEEEIVALDKEVARCSTSDAFSKIYSRYERIAIAFSGAEDVVLIDIAKKAELNPAIFVLDTGRLNPETYDFIERVRLYYQVEIEILFPDRALVKNMVDEKGLYSFRHDGHHECCSIRKTESLRNKLRELDIWVTGQRKTQTLERQSVRSIEIDSVFSTPEKQILKFNPIINWSTKEVWDYIELNEVPYNTLHARGYTSIGCQPCTRPTLPNEDERAGRWWWEKGNKECGIHRKATTQLD